MSFFFEEPHINEKRMPVNEQCMELWEEEVNLQYYYFIDTPEHPIE